MKLDKNSRVYINCRTQEERNMILDILCWLNCLWAGDRSLNSQTFNRAPMVIELVNLRVRHGSMVMNGTEAWRDRNNLIVEARDFRNQWISMKRGIDKWDDL